MRKLWLTAGALAVLGLPLIASDAAEGKPVAVQDAGKQGQGDKPAPAKEEKKEDKLVAEVGKPAPEFSLQDLDGKTVKLSDFKGKIVVLEWFSPKCPACVFAYSDKGPLLELPERLKKEGVVWLAVNSDGGEPGKVEPNKEFFKERKINSMTVLLDPTGATGKTYGAKTTPHCMVIDEKGVLRYRGALDNAPGGRVSDKETKVNYVQKAVEELKGGKAVTTSETKSYG